MKEQLDAGEALSANLLANGAVELCAEKLMEHKCLTAMNLDGGTSAILWYDGEVVTRCSNTRTPEGRYLPNAWVYTYKTN